MTNTTAYEIAKTAINLYKPLISRPGVADALKAIKAAQNSDIKRASSALTEIDDTVDDVYGEGWITSAEANEIHDMLIEAEDRLYGDC